METTRSVTINLRLADSTRDLIDRAAAAVGKSRTEFLVEAARREAETVLLDKCFFALGNQPFAAIAAALDPAAGGQPTIAATAAHRGSLGMRSGAGHCHCHGQDLGVRRASC